MAADYAKIREENISRYGWDTAVLDLLGQLYSDRTHFLFELIQNAEDAGATELAFELSADRLEVWHDGRPFDEADVRGVCGVGQGTKSGDLTAIGRFGIGFKSVYAYTRSPRVHSAGEHFRIESFVRPFPIEPGDGYRDGTLFVFPFDHDGVPAAAAAAASAEIGAALAGLDVTTLLFLRGIAVIRGRGAGPGERVLRRETSAGPGDSRRVVLTSRGSGNRADAEWFVWHRPLAALDRPGLRAEIALRVSRQDGTPRLLRSPASPLVVFFPTVRETFTGALIQGPYRTTPARDNVPEHDPWNQALAAQTGTLLADVLRDVRDAGLLTTEVLTAMPLDPDRFGPGSLLRALFEAVREVLAREPLIPVTGGGYGTAGDLRLADGAGLRELVSPAQLGALTGAGGRSGWVDAPGAEDGLAVGPAGAGPDADRAVALRRYLRDEIGVGEVTPEGFARALTAEFLGGQPDGWIGRLYGFLLRHRELWAGPDGPARQQPIVRLAGGGQVAPFDAAGRPAAYLPGPAAPPDVVARPDVMARPEAATAADGPGLRTVRRAVADQPGARELLEALGYTEPDVVAEALDGVLPRYDGLAAADLDPVQHDADLECVVRALAEAPAGRRDELLARLRRTTFLVGQNAATGERRLMPPPGLYQRAKDLEIYFDGNPDVWFADDTYGPWRIQLRDMGVREQTGLRAREPDQSGNVIIAADFARHERGLDGFDPDADFDGLDFALRHPSQPRSEFIWNVLLLPHRPLVAGVVEKAARQGYQDARREHVRSTMGAAAAAAAWLPGPDGTFHRPAELQLDDLPPGYQRDEGLADALGMVAAAVEAASRQLGIPAGVLRGLSRHPDLVALVERELARREAGADP